MKPRHVIALLLISALGLEAANIERIEVPSASMETAIPVAVVLPDSYAQDADQRYNVIYLLHGAGGDYHQWIQAGSPLHRLADEYEFIAVCPSTGTNWYFDSPINPQIRMETFVSTELVDYIDRNYRTNATRPTGLIHRAVVPEPGATIERAVGRSQEQNRPVDRIATGETGSQPSPMLDNPARLRQLRTIKAYR